MKKYRITIDIFGTGMMSDVFNNRGHENDEKAVADAKEIVSAYPLNSKASIVRIDEYGEQYVATVEHVVRRTM